MARPTRRGRAQPPPEIFLSHASKDRRFAVKLARQLRRDGLRVWYSERHIVGARQWHDEIGAALRRCNWFILVLSPSAVRSKWVKHELLYALRSARFNNRIVPLRYRSCESERLSWTLEGFQHIGFTKGFDAGYSELLLL
jgi:hypothetical protein